MADRTPVQTAGNSNGLPGQHVYGSFIHNPNGLHLIHSQSSSIGNQEQNEFHPPQHFNPSTGLQNVYSASNNYHLGMSDMQTPGYFVHQNQRQYHSNSIHAQNSLQSMYSPRIQHAQGLPSQGTFNTANRFHNQRPQFTLGPSQLQTSVSPQGNFQQNVQLSQGYSQQNQQILALHNQFQAPAPPEHSRMHAGTSVPSFLTANTQQQYGSPDANSHTIHVGRPTQTFVPGHPQQQYSSPSAISNSHPVISECIRIQTQGPQQTVSPGSQQQQYNSCNITSGTYAVPSNCSSTQQQYSSPSAISNSHPVISECIRIQTQGPQQTFSPGNQQQQYNSCNITSGTYPDRSSGMNEQRPPQAFIPLNPQQQYRSSNTSSDANNLPSEHRSIYAQRPQQTLPTNSQRQYISSSTSSNAHLTPSSQRDNLLSGNIHPTQRNITSLGYTVPIPSSVHSYSNGDMLPDYTQTTSINYSESGIVPPSATVNLVSLQQQDRRNQSIDILNNSGITQQTGLAASYEMPSSTLAHHNSVNPAVGYLSSSELRNQSQVQPYLNNSHSSCGMSSSHQTVVASLPTHSLHSKSDTLASANLQQESGEQAVCSVNIAVTCDKTSANCGDLNSYSLASLLNEYNINCSELRETNSFSTEKKQVSTNNSVNKRLWYKYPEEPAPLSFQSDVEVMRADTSIPDDPAERSVTSKEPSPNACIDIQAKCDQSSSVDVADTDISLPGTGNTHASGYQVIENIKSELAMPIKQELPDHLSAPEADLSVERASISDSSPSGVCGVLDTNGGNNCPSATEFTDANSTSDAKDTVTSEPSSNEICTRTLLSNVINSVTLQNTLTAVLQAPIDKSHSLQLPEVDTNIQLTKRAESSNSSISQATDTDIDTVSFLFSMPANSDVIPHTHAANSQSIPSVMVDSDFVKGAALSNMNTQYNVSETRNSEPISADCINTNQILLEKDAELSAKQQHIIFQAQNTLGESRLAVLPSRLQNRRHTSVCLVNNSDETCKPTAHRISALRQSLDSSTLGQSKLQSRIQSGCSNKKIIIGSKVTYSESASKQKCDQKQSCSHEKSLSAREKVFNMWKSGQVVKNKADNAIQRSKSAGVSRISKSRLTVKSTDLKAVPTNGSVGGKSSIDNINKAQEKVATGATVVTKAKKSKRLRKQKPVSAISYALIHGYKLICLKSKNNDLILLCQFQFTCFPDRTLESLNMYIDKILNIKKKVLVHPEKEKIVTFLKKSGYHTDNLIYTISVTDGIKIYHHLYRIKACTNTLCGVIIPDAVSFDDFVKETRPLKSTDRHILEENSTNELTIATDSVKGPVVSATETLQNCVDSPTMQCSDDSLNSRLCIDMSRALSDSDETLAYGESNVDFGNLAEVESAEESFEIHWMPGTQKIGGFIKTMFGPIRWYGHNGDNFLAVDDLCRFCDTTFYEYLSKENTLYSCCQDIESFLNELNLNYPPLKSRHQSLVKHADIGFSKIDNICYKSGQDRSSISKRPLYTQGACNEDSIPHKHPRLEGDTLLTNSHNLMAVKLAPSVVTQEANSENDQSKNPARESSQMHAILKSISNRSTPCLDKENPLTSSGGHLPVEKCLRNSMELVEHPENELIRMTYTPIDITAAMDTDSCCRNTDTIFDHSIIRQHDLISPDSDRSTFSPDEQSFSIFDDGSNPDALPTNCGKQTLNQCRQNNHQPESFLFVSYEDGKTVSKDTPDRCLSQQVDISVKHLDEPEVEAAGSNGCHLETAERLMVNNTPFERDTSVDCSDKSVAGHLETAGRLMVNNTPFERDISVDCSDKSVAGHLETAGRLMVNNTPFERDTSVDCSDKSVAGHLETAGRLMVNERDIYVDCSDKSVAGHLETAERLMMNNTPFERDISVDCSDKSVAGHLETAGRLMVNNTPFERDISVDCSDKSVTGHLEIAGRLMVNNTPFERDISVDCSDKSVAGHLETVGRLMVNNTPFERDTSVDCSDKSVTAKTKPQESLDDCEIVGANEQIQFMKIENCSMKAELCSDLLTKDASDRDSMTVPNTVNMAANVSSAQQAHTIDGSSQGYTVVVLPSSQSGRVSDINTDNTTIIDKSTSRALGEDDSDVIMCDTFMADRFSKYDQKYRDKTDVSANGKLPSEHGVAHQSTKHSTGMTSSEDIETACLAPSSVQCLEFQRCVDDMDIVTSSNTSILATSSYRKAYAKLWQQYRALLGDNTRLKEQVAELKKDCKGCKHYEEVIHLMITDYKWGDTNVSS